jgi:transaldolase
MEEQSMSENKFLRWMTSETQTVYWHDSAIMSELEDAIGNGAKGVTTNPFLINSTLHAEPVYWADYLKDVPRELAGAEKVEALMQKVTAHISDRLKPFFETGDIRYGRCCAQTNPNKPGDKATMFEQAKRYAAWGKSICIKLPATKSGIELAEECAALGYNVVVTVSFTVPQCLAIGAALQRGIERARAAGIEPGLAVAVLMVGRLDDYLRDVAQDTSDVVTENDIIHAGTPAIKRAYQIFNERGYEAYLMPAGCRGTYHIVDLAGARMIMSIAPKIAQMLGKLEGPFEERINVPVPQDIIDRLMTMPEFRKAYEPDGMSPEEFITFGSTNRTLDQFVNDGWNPLAALKI